MNTPRRRSSPLRNHPGLITPHARYAMISPTRTPSCLSVLASSLLFEFTIVFGGTISAPLLHGLGLRLNNRWGAVRRLTGGGGVTGFGVGDTGSSSGMIVYLLTGCPICATADPPYTDCQCRHITPKRSPFHRRSQVAPANAAGRSKLPTIPSPPSTALVSHCSAEFSRLLTQ